MEFGENLVRIRKERGITRKDLAEKLGIPYTTLRNYEKGDREPGHKTLISLSLIFDVSVDELIGLERNRMPASTNGDGFEDRAIRLIQAASRLSAEQQGLLLALLEAAVRTCQQENPQSQQQTAVSQAAVSPAGSEDGHSSS